MHRTFAPASYAIDFGTSNTLLLGVAADGVSERVPLDPDAPDPSVLKSVLFFAPETGWVFGVKAISEYGVHGARGRLLRSIKKYLPDESFRGTRIGEQLVSIEDLIGLFLRSVRKRANAYFGTDVKRAVLGRPARFSESDARDGLAEQRLVTAARRAGFDEVAVHPEPLAAARDFVKTLDRPKLVLVADLGAGTSDFTVLKLGPDGYDPSDVLSVGGVSVAGDAFDSAIMRNKIAVHFGSKVRYTVLFGKNALEMPRALVDQLCSPADAALLERREVMQLLRDIRHAALDDADRERIDRLICLAEDRLGYAVFQAIERCKCALADEASAPFSFAYPTVEIEDVLGREEFSTLGARPHDALFRALDQTLERACVSANDIESVCLTGGTAKLELVRRSLAERFDLSRIQTHDAFHSVIEGLGAHARTLLQPALPSLVVNAEAARGVLARSPFARRARCCVTHWRLARRGCDKGPQLACR